MGQRDRPECHNLVQQGLQFCVVLGRYWENNGIGWSTGMAFQIIYTLPQGRLLHGFSRIRDSPNAFGTEENGLPSANQSSAAGFNVEQFQQISTEEYRNRIICC
jgi:hypothetical protein